MNIIEDIKKSNNHNKKNIKRSEKKNPWSSSDKFKEEIFIILNFYVKFMRAWPKWGNLKSEEKEINGEFLCTLTTRFFNSIFDLSSIL